MDLILNIPSISFRILEFGYSSSVSVSVSLGVISKIYDHQEVH